MKIALISDTHIPGGLSELPPRLVDYLHSVDLILHTGDLVRLEVLESLRRITETIAVHGNMDESAVVRQLPDRQLISLGGQTVGLIHGNQAPWVRRDDLRRTHTCDDPPVASLYSFLMNEFPEADIIVFGHFHVPLVKYTDTCLLINPGAVSPGRGPGSFAMLELDSGEAKAEIIRL